MLIVDTGVLVAAADRTDLHHAACAAIVTDDPGPLVTTAMVIAETGYLLNRELGSHAEAALYQAKLLRQKQQGWPRPKLRLRRFRVVALGQVGRRSSDLRVGPQL